MLEGSLANIKRVVTPARGVVFEKNRSLAGRTTVRVYASSPDVLVRRMSLTTKDIKLSLILPLHGTR